MSRSRIQDHFVILSQKLDVDKVVPYLREERMLTVDEHEQLSHPMYSMRQKRERLLLLLPRKGRNHFENFGKCLVWSGQGDLAERIGIDVESVPPSPYGPRMCIAYVFLHITSPSTFKCMQKNSTMFYSSLFPCCMMNREVFWGVGVYLLLEEK